MSKFMIDQIISSPFRAETDLTATYSNDLLDQYSVTFPPIVPDSSCPSRQYGFNVQASVPLFDDHWNTPNQSSESPQNHQQVSTSCTPNFCDPSPPLSLVTPESSKSSIPDLDACPPSETTLNTADLISRNEENRRKLAYKGTRLTQYMFSKLVLGETHLQYDSLLRYPRPWKSLKKTGKKLYVRIFNWLNLDDDKKREYLEMMENQYKLKIVTPESSKSSIPNLDACPPSGTTLNTTDLISRNEENRRKLAYKGTRLTQYMFSKLVLGETHLQYDSLLRYPRPWKSLKKTGKKLYVRIFNWLNLDDDKKREYLEMMENQYKLKIVTPESSKSSIPNLDACPPSETTLNTADLISRNEENRRKLAYKGTRLTQYMFSKLVLGETHLQYDSLLRYPRPWKSLKKTGKKLYVRIFNWLKLDDDKKREYLEIVENKHKLKLDSSEEIPVDKKLRPASNQNLNTLPPEGTVIITTDLLSRIEESRMNFTYKKRCLSQETLCRLVLGTSRMHYRKQLDRATSWELLRESGKKLFIRIFNWLELDDDEKREYLETTEIKEELKKVMDSREEMAKQKINRTASIPNLDAFPPEGTIFPTNLLSQNELNDDKKRENLETMEIKEELKRQMGSSEDRQEIPKQKEIHMNFSQMEIETQKNRTASIPNLDACPSDGTILIPTNLLSQNEESRKNFTYKGLRLTQQMFSTLVLRMSKFHYCNLLRYTKSWETSTEPIKKLYVRIFNWLGLDDDKKREYLEFTQINSSEEVLKQKKHRKKFSDMEIESLNAIFEVNRSPTSEERVRIAQEMELDDVTIIDNWFKKRRFKTTKK